MVDSVVQGFFVSAHEENSVKVNSIVVGVQCIFVVFKRNMSNCDRCGSLEVSLKFLKTS